MLLKYLVQCTALHCTARLLSCLFRLSVSFQCLDAHSVIAWALVHALEDGFACTFDVQRSIEVNYGREVAPLSAKRVSRILS